MDSDSDSDGRGGRHHFRYYGLGGGGVDDDSSSSSDEDDGDRSLNAILRRIKKNDPNTTVLHGNVLDERIQNMTDDEWELLGRDIANNDYLENITLCGGALNDHKMSFLFRGLTRSNTIERMNLYENGFSVEGVRSMVPVLRNANNLTQLHLNNNDIQSDGFNLLFRALRDSPIERLSCCSCGIESIEIDSDNTPRHLRTLFLGGNFISANGCRGLVSLLRGGNSALRLLGLSNNEIDDEGVAILVDALQNNTSLESLGMRENRDISNQGQIMLLKLVNDVSSIKATLQSNHTLGCLNVDFDEEIQTHIDMATRINRMNKPESVGGEKVIQTQLNSERRAVLAKLQGVDRSLYSEIDPLHLPELLSLIGRRHARGELYAAVSSSIMTLLSTVNRKKCIQQEMKYHEAKAAEHSDIIAKHAAIIAEQSAIVAEHKAKLEELDDELGAIEAAEGDEGNNDTEHRSNKRRRNSGGG